MRTHLIRSHHQDNIGAHVAQQHRREHPFSAKLVGDVCERHSQRGRADRQRKQQPFRVEGREAAVAGELQ
jgi:hypothetical protein